MKDPAFLFYTADFITGTMFMNNEQLGIYVKLLCAQHQHGGLINKVAFNSLVGDHEIIRTKFIETDDGFYNERLMIEINKRSVKSSNLSANAKQMWENKKQLQSKSKAIALHGHMPTEDVNINVNEVINGDTDSNKKSKKKFTKPNPEQVTEYAKSINFNLDGQLYCDRNDAGGWMVGKNKMRDWKASVRYWQATDWNKNKIERQEAVPNDKGVFHQIQKMIKTDTRKISQLPLQLTFDEAAKLSEQYSPEELSKVFRAMENRADLLAKNDSVYFTAKTWLDRGGK